MPVLGIETATAVCGVALAGDGEVLASAEEVRRNIHAERLLPLLSRVMEQAGCGTEDLSGVAVSIGPGSFTGLRIGLSAAKGFAYALGIPVAAVPTLEALAARATGHAPGGGWIVPVLDARREEVYCQLFTLRSGRAEPAEEVRDERTVDLARRLRMRPLLITGEAAETLRDHVPESARGGVSVLAEPHRRCDAGLIALRGEEAIRAGRTEDPGTLEPRYVKEFFLKVR